MNPLHLEIRKEPQLSRQVRGLFHRAFVLGTMVSFGIALFGCGAASSGGDGKRSSSLTEGSSDGVTVKLSDAPGNMDWFARADVVLSGVEARIDDKWVSLSSESSTVNLLELRGGLNKVLGRVNGTTGSISQMRLIVDSASLTLKDGRVFPLKTPSGEQSGLKVHVEPAIELVTGRAVELMLDFDVSKSFVAQGNPRTMAEARGFLFKPVIRVGNSTVHGAIGGLVFSDACTPGDESDDVPVENATVDVLDAQGALAASNSTIGSGHFAVYGLSEGVYAMGVSATGHVGGLREGIAVYRGNMSDAGVLTLVKSDCGGGGEGGGETETETETATETATETETETETATETGTSVSTDTGTEAGSHTDTSTVTETSTDTSTATDPGTGGEGGGEGEGVAGGWEIFGFDATTGETTLAVIWRTDVPTVATLRVGLSPDDLSVAEVFASEPATEQIVGVEGLIPDTVYYLQVTATDENGVTHQSVVIVKQTKPQH